LKFRKRGEIERSALRVGGRFDFNEVAALRDLPNPAAGHAKQRCRLTERRPAAPGDRIFRDAETEPVESTLNRRLKDGEDSRVVRAGVALGPRSGESIRCAARVPPSGEKLDLRQSKQLSPLLRRPRRRVPYGLEVAASDYRVEYVTRNAKQARRLSRGQDIKLRQACIRKSETGDTDLAPE
jgi:hypothetical protein